MPSSTTHADIPFMVDGDALADVATIMQTLAERLDALTPLSGIAAVPVTASASGQLVVNFPAGKFPVGSTIRVMTDVNTTSPTYASGHSSASDAGVTVRVRHVDGTAATTTVNVEWVAFLEA